MAETDPKMARFEAVAEYIRLYHGLRVTVLKSQEDISAFYNKHTFRTLLFSQQEAGQILSEVTQMQKGNTLRVLEQREYLAWMEKYPLRPEKAVLEIVQALLRSVYPGTKNRPVRAIQAESVVREAKEVAARSLGDKTKHKQSWYANEKQFRDCITAGYQRGALEHFRTMERDAASGKVPGSTAAVERSNTAILRNTARLAAIDGGLPPYVAEQIANQNARNVLAAKTMEEFSQAKVQMIQEYCSAVQKAISREYSDLVECVLYKLDRLYTTDIDLDDWAEELEVTKTNLINQFRKEVGETFPAYLTNLRLRKAAELLITKDLSIAQVAAAVGMPDMITFSKQFRREYGEPPTTYRKNHGR